MMKILVKKDPAKEEWMNGTTHGIGIVLGIIATILLLVKNWNGDDAWHLISTLVFSLTLTLMYTTSTLYHLWKNESQRKLLRKFDHSAIYLLIAGTYTPFCLITLRNVSYYGWMLFAIVWTAALIGIGISFYKMGKLSIIKTLCYIAMGLLVVFAYNPLVATLQGEGKIDALYWLAIGGVFYILGTVFYLLGNYRYMHPLWHLFVLAGSISHFFAVWNL